MVIGFFDSGTPAARVFRITSTLEKLKHHHVRCIWLHQARADGQVKVDRVAALLKTAHVDTKFFGRGAVEPADCVAALMRT